MNKNNYGLKKYRNYYCLVGLTGLEPVTFRFLPLYVTIAKQSLVFQVLLRFQNVIHFVCCGLDCISTILKFLQDVLGLKPFEEIGSYVTISHI